MKGSLVFWETADLDGILVPVGGETNWAKRSQFLASYAGTARYNWTPLCCATPLTYGIREREKESLKEATHLHFSTLGCGRRGSARYANLNLPHWKTRKISMLFRNKPSNYLRVLLHFSPLPFRPYVLRTDIHAIIPEASLAVRN